MAESKATAPDYTLSVEVDMTACVELRAKLQETAAESDEPAPSYNDMIVKAAALALREFERVNGAYRDGRFELYSRVNVGVAVAAQDALVVPTIFDADQKSLGQIARDARGLIDKVRAGKITPPELSGGTFTVSNLGMYGMTAITPIIRPVRVRTLTRMLKPSPKNAFRSPRVHHGIDNVRGGPTGGSLTSVLMERSFQAAVLVSASSAGMTAAVSATHPKMPPWALIISRPMRWNSGKYEPTQSDTTRHS